MLAMIISGRKTIQTDRHIDTAAGSHEAGTATATLVSLLASGLASLVR